MFPVAVAGLFLCIAGVAVAEGANKAIKIDFGPGPQEDGWIRVADGDVYSDKVGYGWMGPVKLDWRARDESERLTGDFVFGHEGDATFRVAVTPGVYRLTLVTGDAEYGDHVLAPRVSGLKLPVLRPGPGEFLSLTVAFEVKTNAVDVTLTSPVNNWVCNTLVLEPANAVEDARVEKIQPPESDKPDRPDQQMADWSQLDRLANPVATHIEQFRRNAEVFGEVTDTGLSREDYLKVIAGNVDRFVGFQNAKGAIIDPYRKAEWQYATPCFALAAATLVAHAQRTDLLEPAAKAMDWATTALSIRRAAGAHEDFYPAPIATALPLLKPRVSTQRYETWTERLRSIDPYRTYRAKPGGNNWNVVALSGEWLLGHQGLRPSTEYVEASIEGQAAAFSDPWGMYLDPGRPMAYDLFPRVWVTDILAHGYSGPRAELLGRMMWRGAQTSLLMASPVGELPAGGRSAHHQWNEAAQCLIFEICAGVAEKQGDHVLARAFKRAAHLSLASIRRWVRPSGELQIVKNWVDPQQRFGYERYSEHSQYNLLAMAMLAMAYEHAEATIGLKEGPSPADTGGFVLDLREGFGKVIANVRGTYVEISTRSNLAYNPTGLIRVHQTGVHPQIGPSDGVTADTVSVYPAQAVRTTAAVGVAWQTAQGQWTRLAQFASRARMTSDNNDEQPAIGPVQQVELEVERQTADSVAFSLRYEGDFGGPEAVIEHYQITPGAVRQTTELPGYSGAVQVVFPVLADDGRERSSLEIDGPTLTLSAAGSSQVFTAGGAGTIQLPAQLYPSRNGWVRIGVAEWPARTKQVTLLIEPRRGLPTQQETRQAE